MALYYIQGHLWPIRMISCSSDLHLFPYGGPASSFPGSPNPFGGEFVFEKFCGEDIRRARETLQSLDSKSADACFEICHCAFHCAQRVFFLGMFGGLVICELAEAIHCILG